MSSPATSLPLGLEDFLSLDSGPLGSPDAPAPPVVKATQAIGSGGLISEAELSDLFGISSRRVRDLLRDGVIEKTGRQFDRRDCTRAYTAWLREKASRGVAVMDELKAEKIRQARAAADKIELQNQASRGELLPAAEVVSGWAGILRDVRAAMLSIPSRCGAEIQHLSLDDIAVIAAEIKTALEVLSDDD